jgi:RHS repeat-associated protein
MGTVLFTKTWVWCGGTQPCQERDGDNQVTQRFFAQGFQTLAPYSSLPASFYYTNDHLGSVREVLDATGTLRTRYDYDAWGQRTKLSGDLDADFGYTGHLHHKQTGLILTHYRAYDPRLARWLSRDPIAESGGINLYGYVLNRPTVAIDPDGRDMVMIVNNSIPSHVMVATGNNQDGYTFHERSIAGYEERSLKNDKELNDYASKRGLGMARWKSCPEQDQKAREAARKHKDRCYLFNGVCTDLVIDAFDASGVKFDDNNRAWDAVDLFTKNKSNADKVH